MGARWIWFPGQLTAHLHADMIKRTIERCVNVGYSGRFRQAEHYAYFRKTTVLSQDTKITWTVPTSRCLMQINGSSLSITQRETILPAGKIEILVIVDFSEALPCIFIEGELIFTDEEWESSLDLLSWVPVECEPAFSDRNQFPNAHKTELIKLDYKNVRSIRNAVRIESGFALKENGKVVLDFEQMELGQLSFWTNGEGTVSVFVGQSLSEVENRDESLFEQKPIAPVEIKGRKYVTLPERCVRYVCFESSGNCEIEHIQLWWNAASVDFRGDFECDDKLLNDIWQASVSTMRSCMHNFYIDGLSRDGLPWALDGTVSVEAGDCVFFDTTIARHTILSQTLPQKPLIKDLGIADFTLYTIMGFEYYYKARGDTGFIEMYWDRIEEILSMYRSLQDEYGFIGGNELGNIEFLPDWSPDGRYGPDLHGKPAYAQMLLLHVFEVGGSLAACTGRDPEGYRKAAQELRKNIIEIFWDRDRAVFINGFDVHGKADTRISAFAQIFGILFDLVDLENVGRLADVISNTPSCNAENISLNYYWRLQAYLKAGKIDRVLDALKKIWGGMLARGNTRFFEDIRPHDDEDACLGFYGRDFGNSLCHAWAGAAPITAIVRGVLGVSVDEPGFVSCLIRPQLGALNWIKGSVPTPFGDIQVEFHKDKGGRIHIPGTMKARVDGWTTPDSKFVLQGPGSFDLSPSRAALS